jgi:hypothetical protein
MNLINWRTDIENAPKDRPILVIDSRWDDCKPCRYTYQVVEWTRIDKTSNEYGWAYDYDHDYDDYRTVNNPKFWMEILERPEIK